MWVVFDRDGHATFHEAIHEAKKYPFVHMCWTNPCIEAWFLMHFRKLPNFPRQKEMLLTSIDTPIGNSTTLIRREEVWEKIVDPQLVLTALKSQWSKYSKTNTDLFDHLKGKMDFALTQCVGTGLREDFQKFGSLIPEVLFAIARLGTENDEAAEKKLGTAWHALCCQKRAETRLSEIAAGPGI